ncbi:MAG: penicillin acylase family protein [Gemmatimonadota bacterium]
MRHPLPAAVAFAVCGALACANHATSDSEAARLKARAQAVHIVRDDWGIAHVHGTSDADAVFGMIYAQAEDDFNRVETNYLNSLGRLAEAEGEGAVIQDLRQRLFTDSLQLKIQYEASPRWLKQLMDAWADGLNYYLLRHPAVHPRVLTHFEPWMPLSYSEGSIGGDIEGISLARLEDFYGKGPKTVAMARPAFPPEPGGSNGFAIAPSNTAGHHALLLINPHTSFFFRAELQMTSDSGLNAYGAVTWGQFFIYQGWNPRVGWMHTSSGVDAVDEYAETIVRQGDSLYYREGGALKPVISRTITVPYKGAAGLEQKAFTVYRTGHGPIVREADGKWISVRLMQEPVKALTESYSRTKARNYQEFRQTVELRSNSSNNTVYADADGNIAYFHASFIPKRDPRFDWNHPVDGSDSATEWNGLLTVEETPSFENPTNGWIQNTNNSPWTAAGPNSPKQKDFPSYVDVYEQNPRGVHAIRLLEARKDFTLQRLIDAAFDSYQPSFALLIPPLIKDWDRLPRGNPLKDQLAEQIKLLRGWDYRWSAESVPTSLAVYWGEAFWRVASKDADNENISVYDYMATKATAVQRLTALATASDTLTADFGKWQTPWGEINRFQRLTDDIVHPFADSGASIPVPFTSARWGSLASFGAAHYNGSKKIYGSYGNSFVAVVEFGDSVSARAITAGGESGDPKSKHFNDQAERYASGNLRPVYFYPGQLKGHTEREYRPGE